jgi:hypothetical protein
MIHDLFKNQGALLDLFSEKVQLFAVTHMHFLMMTSILIPFIFFIISLFN